MGAHYLVDLDGTLAQYGSQGPFEEIGPPVPAMLERVRNWLAHGVEVRVFTARASVPEHVPPVRAWLDSLGLQEVGITNRKDYSTIEIWDDRAVQVEFNTGRVIEDRGPKVVDKRRVR